MDNTTNQTNYHINGLVAILIVIYSAVSVSGYGRITNVAAAVIMVVLLFSFKSIPLYGSTGKCVKSFFCYFIFLCITSIPNMGTIYYFFGTTVLYTFIEFFPILILFYLIKSQDLFMQKKIFKYISLFWFVLVCYSIFVFSKADMGGRTYAQTSRGNFLGGGYPVAYASSMIAVVIFSCLLSGKIHRRHYTISVLAMGASILHVIATQSVITIIATLCGLGVSFVFRTSRRDGVRKIRVLLVLIFGFSAAAFFALNYKSIGLWIVNQSSLFSNPIFSQRVEEIGLYLYDNTETYHVGARSATLTDSFYTFLDYPIFGVGYKVGNVFENLNSVGIGTHSEILDSFAKFGIVGAIPLILVYYYRFKDIYKKEGLEIFYPMIATFLILSGLNPFISVQTNFVFFLYIPLMLHVIKDWSK